MRAPHLAGWQRVLLPLPLAVLLGLLAVLLTTLALRQPWAAQVQVGGGFDSPFLAGFYPAEYSNVHQTDFRWSLPMGEVLLPGVGRSPVALRLHGDARDTPLLLDVGSGTQQIALRPGWQTLHILPTPDWRGDVRVQLQAAPQTSPTDPRQRGVVLSHIAVGSLIPTLPLAQPLLLGISTALAVLLTGAALRGRRSRTLAMLLVGGGLAVGSALLLAQGAWRLWLTSYSMRWLLVLLLGMGIWLLVQQVLGGLARRGWLSTPAALRDGLAAAAVLAGVLRFGAMAYPLNHNSDLPFILGRTWMIRNGEWLKLFLPNPALTPVQWEMDVTIPRSPFYYILTVPVTFLPGRAGDELGMLAFSSAVDAVAVVLVGLLVVAVGGGRSAAILAAVLAGMLPFGVQMIVSWGVLPTLLAQCLSLLALVLWLHLRPHLHRRWAWLLLAGVLTLAFLSYPTALVFLGATGGLLVLLLALRRDPATLPTLQAGVLAVALAALLYYGWHVPALLARTLPELFGVGAPAAGGGGGELDFSLKRTLDAIALQPIAKYSPLVLLVAAGGAALLAVRLHSVRWYAGAVLLAWGLAYLPFALLDEYIVTLILKQVLWLLPLLAVLAGLVLGRWQQSQAGRLVGTLLLLWVGWQGAVLLVDLVRYAFIQLK